MCHVIDHHRRSDTEEDANQSAGNADENRLDEELGEDVDAFGPDTHAQADFTRALRYGNIHDIHNPDATD